MKSNIMKLTRWFCLKLTLNELTSIVPVLIEVLAGSRQDIRLKPEEKPPHYRNFRVDPEPPLLPESRHRLDWQELLRKHEEETGRKILTQSRAKYLPSPGCRCQHCDAPTRYLAINNGKLRSQVRCKICGGRSPASRRVYDKSKFLCPSCRYALSKRQETEHFTSYRCTNIKCSHYLAQKKGLTIAEQKMCGAGNSSFFKLHYHHREYHIDRAKLKAARPSTQSKVDLGRIHNSDAVLGLVLTFSINLGLSSRVTRRALKGIFDIDISHQTILNYINASAEHLHDFIDQNNPIPSAIAAADETYIIVENRWQYTWFIIDSATRAICGYNLSNNRSMVPALALLHDTYGLPEDNDKQFELATDGNPSYDCAIMAYNQEADRQSVVKRTVIGLKNLDEESTQYRRFKQLIERLNRTYKYHTRPRAGFKSFEGAVALTTLFVAYYNFMRPHSSCNEKAPVQLECLQGCALMPEAWIRIINSAAA